MARDLAYQADDESVYFRINRFPDYGKLAHLNLEELRRPAACAATSTKRNTSAISRCGKPGTRTTAT